MRPNEPLRGELVLSTRARELIQGETYFGYVCASIKKQFLFYFYITSNYVTNYRLRNLFTEMTLKRNIKQSLNLPHIYPEDF